MKQQATRNTDLIREQQRRQLRRELLIAIPMLLAAAGTVGYAVAGLLGVV